MSEKDNQDLNKDLELNNEGQPSQNEEVTSEEVTAEVVTSEETTSKETTTEENTPAAVEEAPEAGQAVEAAANNEGPKKPNGMIGWMVTSLVLAIVLVVVLIKPPFAGTTNEAVVTVNGDKITTSQLLSNIVESSKDTVMKSIDDMTNTLLVEQAAKAKNITITDADIDKELASVKENFSSEEQFNSALQSYGLTLDQLKGQLRTQVQIIKLFKPEVKVTEDQIKSYYDENKASLGTPEEVEASHILVDTEQEAKDIINQLNNGADFAKLAKEKSKDTSNSDKGGDLGYFKSGDMDPDFEKAAFSLKVGEISKEPVKTSYGYHIIKVTGHKDAVVPPLDEVKAKIQDDLENQAIGDLYTKWLPEQKTKATITNKYETKTDSTDGAATEESAQ